MPEAAVFSPEAAKMWQEKASCSESFRHFFEKFVNFRVLVKLNWGSRTKAGSVAEDRTLQKGNRREGGAQEGWLVISVTEGRTSLLLRATFIRP